MKKIDWRRLFGIALIVVGLACVVWHYIPAIQVYLNQREFSITRFRREDIEANQADKSANYDPNQVTMVTPEMVDAARKRIREGHDNVQVIGALAMPEQKISVSVMNGLSEAVLLSGAGTFYPDQQMGKNNYPLASHNMDAIAPGLLLSPMVGNTKKGDMIYLTDLDTIYVYETYFAEYTDPSRVDLVEMKWKEPIVTLVTCGESTSTAQRYIVQGRLVDKMPIGEAPKEILDYFK